jgi:glycosidase
MEDFRMLVKEVHGMDMKVIIDWVANHTGADHVWTQSHPGFYLKNEAGEFYDTHGWDDVIDLDYTSGAMRDAMIRSMEFWVRECDIDGFRCDMAMLVPVDFWAEARTALDRLKPLFWLAECDQWNEPQYLEVFDAAYAWRWMHASHDYYRYHLPLHTLMDTIYGYDGLKPKNAIRALFTSNHDENSWNGTEYEKYGDMAALLAVFSCTWNGLPLMYSGQEIPNHKRLAFFDKDALDWDAGASLHAFYRNLLGLRYTHPALRAACDEVQTRFIAADHPDKILLFERVSEGRSVVVMLNCSPYPLDVHIYDPGVLGTTYSSLFTGELVSPGQDPSLHIPSWGYQVLFT